MELRKLNVCYTPLLLPLYDIANSVVVVIDIFRATSSICYAIESGAAAIIPVTQPEECATYSQFGYLLAAERDGVVVPEFDCGNSPLSYSKDKVAGKTIVLTTTNGTNAIHMSKGAKMLLIGSFFNLTALANWISKTQVSNLLLLCSGWRNKFSMEDVLFAGALVHGLKGAYELDDAGIAAEQLYNLGKKDMTAFLKDTAQVKRLKTLHAENDITFCLKVDLCTSIPILQGKELIKMQMDTIKLANTVKQNLK